MAMPCSAQEERMPGRDEEKDAKASCNRASTDTLSRGGARLLSFSHHDATHMHTQSPRIRVYDTTHPRKHQSMQFSYRLYNNIIHPGMLMPSQESPIHGHATLATYILSSVRKSSMVTHLRHTYLIIRPQVIHGQAHSSTATYHPSTNHQWFRHPPSTCCLSAPTNHLWFRHTLLPQVSFHPFTSHQWFGHHCCTCFYHPSTSRLRFRHPRSTRC